MNRTGTAYAGHFDVWLIDREQMLLEATSNLIPDSTPLAGWVNGSFYTPAGETIGILRIPETVRATANMQSYNSEIDDTSTKHKFLARHQDTRYAVISVNTPEEKKQFKRLIAELPELSGTNPDWKMIVSRWNATANGETIFYKVSYQCVWLQCSLLTHIQLAEHLQSYYTKWKKNINEKNSISQVVTKVRALENKHRNTARSLGAPAVMHLDTPIPNNRLQGQNPSQPLVSSSLYQAIVPRSSWPAADISALAEPSTIHTHTDFNMNTHFPPHMFDADEDTFGAGEDASGATIAPKRKRTLNDNGEPRKKRTCPKCGDPNCKGAGRMSYCDNQCQDCGQRDCEGRNSKHPGKDCAAGKLLSGATGGRPRKTMS